MIRMKDLGNFPGSPVVKTLSFQCKGQGFNPWLANQDPTCCSVAKAKKKKKKTWVLGQMKKSEAKSDLLRRKKHAPRLI